MTFKYSTKRQYRILQIAQLNSNNFGDEFKRIEMVSSPNSLVAPVVTSEKIVMNFWRDPWHFLII